VSTPPETALPEQPSYRQTDPAQTAEGPAAPDPQNPPWGLLQALLTWIGSVFLLLLPQFFAIPYLVSHYRGVRPTAVVTRFGKVSAKKALGWSWSKGFGIWSSVGVALLLFVLAWMIALTLGNKETELERILQSSRAAALMIAFIATTTAPLVEETIYRGILYPALQRTIGPGFAVLVVALMFAGPHIPQYWPNAGAILSIALLSVVLTVVRARTGRLLPCFVIHLVFNGVQSLIIVSEPYLRAYIERARPQPNTVTLSYLLHFLS
jgi:membrane protease YdiL (CAAX protease family)